MEYTLEEIKKQEQELQWTSFHNSDALQLIRLVVEAMEKTYPDKNVGIRIKIGDLIVAQYLMDGRTNTTWLDRKMQTVEESGHRSYYVFHTVDKDYPEWKEDERYAICGGGFPIIIKGEVKVSFCVSGLRHDKDHQLIIDAIRKHREAKGL